MLQFVKGIMYIIKPMSAKIAIVWGAKSLIRVKTEVLIHWCQKRQKFGNRQIGKLTPFRRCLIQVSIAIGFTQNIVAKIGAKRPEIHRCKSGNIFQLLNELLGQSVFDSRSNSGRKWH